MKDRSNKGVGEGDSDRPEDSELKYEPSTGWRNTAHGCSPRRPQCRDQRLRAPRCSSLPDGTLLPSKVFDYTEE